MFNLFSGQINKKNNFGFTIIELIVSASIIALMSALIIANFRGSTQKSSLDNEAERLASILREANINSLIGLTVGGSRPAGGFGLHLETCSLNCRYLMFANKIIDQNEDYLYDPNDPKDVSVQDIGMLENDVYVKLLTLKTGGEESEMSPVDIVFVPPQGKIMINGSIDYEAVIITLGFTNTDYSKQIVINSASGQISIE